VKQPRTPKHADISSSFECKSNRTCVRLDVFLQIGLLGESLSAPVKLAEVWSLLYNKLNYHLKIEKLHLYHGQKIGTFTAFSVSFIF